MTVLCAELLAILSEHFIGHLEPMKAQYTPIILSGSQLRI